MKGYREYILFLFYYLMSCNLYAEYKSVRIKWDRKVTEGTVEIRNGILKSLELKKGNGFLVNENSFRSETDGIDELLVCVDSAKLEFGPGATVVSLKANSHSFSFFLRDITDAMPVYIPEYHVIVSTEHDIRSYSDIEQDIQSKGLLTKVQKIEQQPETSFEVVAKNSRDMSGPVWLGIGRDVRLFQVYEEMNDNDLEGKIVKPICSTVPMKLPEVRNDELTYFYVFGRGIGTHPNVVRFLEEGSKLIYHSELIDDDICYHSVSFVSGEEHDLSQADTNGSHYLVFDYYSSMRNINEKLKVEMDEKLAKEEAREGLVLCINTTIKNRGDVPRYAWFMLPRPGNGWMKQYPYQYDREKGISYFKENMVFCVSKLNGKVVPNEEMAVLLQPGEEITCQYILPHKPISWERGIALADRDFSTHYTAAQDYWHKIEDSAARIHIPEHRIDEMVKAGLNHLYLITFGSDSSQVFAPNIGIYHPIGTESAPIILYYLSMGWSELAKRSLNYFLAWQMPDGSIQNYGGYMVETGAFLWASSEYFRYTRDIEWIKENKDKLLLSCKYLINWRNQSKVESLKGRGYGMVDGKFADVNAPYRQFSVNAYSCMGVSRMAEVFRSIDPIEASLLEKEALEWRKDIWESISHQLEITPVVPLGDGTWVSALSPWAEGESLRALYYKEEKFWSHGCFIDSDVLCGPLYLIFCEIIDPECNLAGNMLQYTRELFCQGSTALSQPYYSRHNWLQLRRGEVKPFLSTYYGTFAAHADRQTYSFWEHLHRVSPHKTHEEATFLMDTRWMLYMEIGDTLSVFRGIPRKWLDDENEISLCGVGSYFGNLNIWAKSDLKNKCITASVSCYDESRRPNCVTIRIPHPFGNKPIKVSGGIYDAKKESVIILNFEGRADVVVQY